MALVPSILVLRVIRCSDAPPVVNRLGMNEKMGGCGGRRDMMCVYVGGRGEIRKMECFGF